MSALRKYLKETSLGRLNQHANDLSYPIGIISAFRHEDSYEVNVQHSKELASTLQRSGYGFVYIDGDFIENAGTSTAKKVREQSIFVMGKKGENGQLKGLLKQLATKYIQDAFIYREVNEKEAVMVDRTNGFSEQKLGTFHPNRISAYMSSLRNGKGTFVFEGLTIEYLPTIMERIKEKLDAGEKPDVFFSIK